MFKSLHTQPSIWTDMINTKLSLSDLKYYFQSLSFLSKSINSTDKQSLLPVLVLNIACILLSKYLTACRDMDHTGFRNSMTLVGFLDLMFVK